MGHVVCLASVEWLAIVVLLAEWASKGKRGRRVHQDLGALVVARGGMVAQALVALPVRRESLARKETSVNRDQTGKLDPLALQVRKIAKRGSATRKRWCAVAAVPQRNAPLIRCQFAG